MPQVGWNGQGKPDIGAQAVFTGGVEVRDWQAGDTLKVLDYVAVLGTTDTVPILWNLDRQSSDTAPVEALRMTPQDLCQVERIAAITDMQGARPTPDPFDPFDVELFCGNLYDRGYRLVVTSDPSPLE